jgi:hypothetical protein
LRKGRKMRIPKSNALELIDQKISQFDRSIDEGIQLEAILNQVEGKLRENIKMASVLYAKNFLGL